MKELLNDFTDEMIKSYGFESMILNDERRFSPFLYVTSINKYRINDGGSIIQEAREDFIIDGEDNIIRFLKKLKLPEERENKLNDLGI